MGAVFTKRMFEKGQVIMREGEMEMVMYHIIIGSVGIYVNYGTDSEQLVDTVSDDDFFGEMELINVRSRTATVVALEKTECLVIDRDTFGDYIKNYPEKCLAIMQSLSDKLRRTNAAFREMCRIAHEAEAEGDEDTKKSSWLKRLLGIANEE